MELEEVKYSKTEAEARAWESQYVPNWFKFALNGTRWKVSINGKQRNITKNGRFIFWDEELKRCLQWNPKLQVTGNPYKYED